MMDGAQLDLGFEHFKAAFDVGQGLVLGHDLSGRQIVSVGDQQELAIHRTRQGKGTLVDIVGKELAF